MFKVMITQIKDNDVIGRTVLVENFDDIVKAKKAGEEYSKIYKHQIFQIKEYKNDEDNIISFNGQDTGRIVYENIGELMEAYMNDDVDIVEWLDCVLNDKEDELYIVAHNISDEWLTKLLDKCGADNWHCKNHETFEY